jgi:hypothetical protein
MYAKIKNTTCVEYPYTFQNLQSENPYTNYGNNFDVAYWYPQTNDAIQNGYTLVEVINTEKPTYDEEHQSCTINTQPTYVDGQWLLEWTVSDFTPEQQEEYNKQKLQNIKNQGKSLLTETDWTSIPSIADPAESQPYLTNRQDFLTYRSAVRAIVLNTQLNSVYPTKPNEQWSS